jgi:hypothetical protein
MVTLFDKKLDLATLGDWEDVRAADVSEVTALTAWKAADAALRECWREQGGNDGALSGPNTQDAITAMEASQREPGLRRDEIRLKLVYERAARHHTAVKAARQAEGLKAIRPAVKRDVEAIFAKLDDVREECRAALGRLEEAARKLGVPTTGFEGYLFVDWFVSSANQESALEFRRRLARAEGLLS